MTKKYIYIIIQINDKNYIYECKSELKPETHLPFNWNLDDVLVRDAHPH